jgi:hypothetical protein
MLSYRRSSDLKVTNRADGCRPAASSTRLSGTPVHSPMAVQPSSQVCFVICVRDGRRFNSASDHVPGRATVPVTDSRHSPKLLVSQRRYVSATSARFADAGSIMPTAGKDE